MSGGISLATGESRRTEPVGLFTRLLRLFFHYFYHQFAWTYDFVAAVVSFGRWNRWVQAVVPYLVGQDILEIGFGPGHLQAHLLAGAGLRVIGLDESRQMVALAKKRLRRSGLLPRLTRGRAQDLPFAAQAFGSVVSTFPSEYVFDERTLAQVYRVLRRGGRFVVVPAAWITGRGLGDRAAAWLFKVTHQAPPSARELLTGRLEQGLRKAGFLPEFETVEMGSSLVFVINALKAAVPREASRKRRRGSSATSRPGYQVSPHVRP